MKNNILLLSLILLLGLTGCARAPRSTDILQTIEPYPIGGEHIITAPDVARTNVYHEVGPGETVWRISKMYDVKIESIANVNNIADITKLEKGQKLLIPDAAPLRAVVPLWPSKKWKYIIIHHSATDVGNALSFDYVHSNKRKWKGLGYHFVIDNGTSGKEDGQVEVSPRWIHQEDGAHCKAGDMNCRSIGICLVGNFSEDKVSKKQMDSLAWLVNKLRKEYSIPESRILGHSDVKGASTECPGTRFPWNDFRYKLRRY
ncbi:MAG: N-acetylmuramoyl-L-alanine amidase [Candidatus Omnitrophota bacterium]